MLIIIKQLLCWENTSFYKRLSTWNIEEKNKAGSWIWKFVWELVKFRNYFKLETLSQGLSMSLRFCFSPVSNYCLWEKYFLLTINRKYSPFPWKCRRRDIIWPDIIYCQWKLCKVVLMFIEAVLLLLSCRSRRVSGLFWFVGAWSGRGRAPATNAGLATTKLQQRPEKTVHTIVMSSLKNHFYIPQKFIRHWNGIYTKISLLVCKSVFHFLWPRVCWSCVVSSGPCVSRADTGAGARAGRENAGDWVTGGARGGEDRYTGTGGKGTWPTYLPGAYYIELHQT